jgi:membrane protein implicated in regulation of membrane protease activity
MCHLILLTPILALPVFWLVPLNLAIPIYVIIGLIAGFLYWLIAKSMGRRPETGSESLIGAAGEVVSKLGPGGHAKYLIRSQGELWSANSPDLLQTGEKVSVEAVDGIRILVRRNGNPVALTKEAVGKVNERHCH